VVERRPPGTSPCCCGERTPRREVGGRSSPVPPRPRPVPPTVHPELRIRHRARNPGHRNGSDIARPEARALLQASAERHQDPDPATDRRCSSIAAPPTVRHRTLSGFRLRAMDCWCSERDSRLDCPPSRSSGPSASRARTRAARRRPTGPRCRSRCVAENRPGKSPAR
jgi:hypothetical protein